MGPRFHTKPYSSWGCRVEGEDGWKSCSMPVTWITSCQDYCLYMQWKGLFKISSLMSCQKSVLVGFFVCHEKCDTTLPFLQLFSTEKSLCAINIPQPFEFTSLHIYFSWILLVLQLCYLISTLLQEKARIQLLVEMRQTFLEDKCAEDYHKEIHTRSCLSAFSIVIWMGFAFALSNFHGCRFVLFKNQLFFSLFHVCWMLLFRFFRDVKKSWKILHILRPNRQVLKMKSFSYHAVLKEVLSVLYLSFYSLKVYRLL